MKFYLSISNHKLILRAIYSFGIVLFISILALAYFIPGRDGSIAPMFFFLGFISIFVGEISILLFILFFLLTKKTKIEVNKDLIKTESGISIPMAGILDIKLKVNRNNFQSLMIIKLIDGRIYSITPTVKFSENAMREYNGFRKELSKHWKFE